MDGQYCPFIGLNEDPSTFLNFPSEGNICLLADSKEQITLKYQEEFCLSSNYTNCSKLLFAEAKKNSNAELESEKDREELLTAGYPTKKTRLLLLRTGIPLLLFSLIIVMVTIAVYSQRQNNDQFNMSKPEKNSKVLLNTPNQAVYASDFKDTDHQTSLATNKCPPPDNWVYYFIQPDDDIIKLANDNKLTINQLLKVNCLTSMDQLVPGLMLYIPIIPTQVISASSTPTVTNTPLPTLTNTPTVTVTPTITATKTRGIPTSDNQPKPTKTKRPKPTSPPNRPTPTSGGRPTPTNAP